METSQSSQIWGTTQSLGVSYSDIGLWQEWGIPQKGEIGSWAVGQVGG